MTALRLSWLKLGHSPAFGSITETIVTGERSEYLVTALEPDSPYRVCMVPMETSNLYLFDETPVCIETETAPLRMYNPTTTLNREQEKEPYKNPNLPLAAIIGGAVALVTIALLALVCWYVHRNGSIRGNVHLLYSLVHSRGSKTVTILLTLNFGCPARNGPRWMFRQRWDIHLSNG